MLLEGVYIDAVELRNYEVFEVSGGQTALDGANDRRRWVKCCYDLHCRGSDPIPKCSLVQELGVGKRPRGKQDL